MKFEDLLIQFDYYGSTASICDDGVADIKAMFDEAILTITGYTCIRMLRDVVFPSAKIEPDDIRKGIMP